MGSRMPCSAVQRLLWKSGRLQLSDWMGMSFDELRVSGQVLFDGAASRSEEAMEAAPVAQRSIEPGTWPSLRLLVATAIMLRLLSSKLTA